MDRVTEAHEQTLIEAAGRSTCERDQRGALLVDCHDGPILEVGWNGLPAGMLCSSGSCQPSCAKTAEHAEAAAIRRCVYYHRSMSIDMDIIHAKVVDGAIAVSRAPHEKACKSCAVQMLAHGVSGIWLYTHHGWRRWTIPDYYNFACDGK